MRIAFHAPAAAWLEPGPTGDRVFIGSLVAGLRARGHEISFVSRVDARDFWRHRVPSRRLISEAISVCRRMKKLSPDAWFVYAPYIKYPDMFGWWQRPKRYILFSAGAGPGTELPRGWRWLFRFAHRRSLRRADKVVTFAPRTLDALRSAGVPEERLCILPPAVKAGDWMPSREEARRRLGLPQEAPIILCVSRLTGPRDDGKPWKTESVLELLDALALAALPPDAVFVLVGDGPSRQRVEEKVAKLKLCGKVRLVGSVPHDNLKWFYAACDFFAFPDQRDLLRLAMLEPQACGRPVVTMHTRSAELTVEAGRTGLLAKDLGQFQAHLAALASDRARCESMGKGGPEYVVKFHSHRDPRAADREPASRPQVTMAASR